VSFVKEKSRIDNTFHLYTLGAMRALFLLIFALPLLSGCLEQATPTPVEIQQYPATWTPAPTGTSTPYPPTATLVIQRTPGAAPTRDPNARVLPNVPRYGFGLWLTWTSETPKILEPLAARANVIVTDGTGNFQRGSNTFVFLTGEANTFAANSTLASQYNGVVVSPTIQTELTAVRTAIAPRLVLVSLPVTNTTGLAEIGSVIDGVRLENFLSDPNATPGQFGSEADWKRDVETLATLSSNSNYTVLAQTRLGETTGNTTVSAEQWFNYSLASFLIAVNGTHSFFNFESASAPQSADSPLNTREIGTPIGGTIKQNGVYQRRFTRGLVLVNPTEEASAFALPRNYLDSNGARIDQVNMLPHTGMILLNTE
jgi:hypothetical protein